jgi:hypothetical protein
MGWYQALLPMGIMAGCYALSHFSLWGLDKLQNEGKVRGENKRRGVSTLATKHESSCTTFNFTSNEIFTHSA